MARLQSHLRIPAGTPPMFLEEPIWPPEDFTTRRGSSQRRLDMRLRMPRLSIQADDEWARELMRNLPSRSAATEYLKVAAADELRQLAPHSPVFRRAYMTLN
jgi:hypothetical protein